MRRGLTRLLATPLLAASLVGPPIAAAQDPAVRAPGTHLLVVTGLGGSAEYSDLFHRQGAALVDAARERWRLPEDRVTWLAEDPARAPARIAARGTREAVQAQITALAGRARADDGVMIVLIGHGTAAGESSKLNLPGPDVTGEDLAAWLTAFRTQTVAVVNTASASGGFVAPLSSARRIVVTATRSAREAERTHFAGYFVEAMSADGADTDKDRRVSLLEAFAYARAEVERFYERENLMLTEHALLDDDGDGQGSAEPTPGSGDGALAAAFHLGGPVGGGSGEASTALLAEKARIESAIASLRSGRAGMPAADYESRHEELLLSLARVTRSIRDADDGNEAPP